VWPRNLSDEPVLPGLDVNKYVEAKKRAYIRSIKRKL